MVDNFFFSFNIQPENVASFSLSIPTANDEHCITDVSNLCQHQHESSSEDFEEVIDLALNSLPVSTSVISNVVVLDSSVNLDIYRRSNSTECFEDFGPSPITAFDKTSILREGNCEVIM